MAIIDDVRFMSADELKQIPSQRLHGIFRQIATVEDLKSLNGFFRI
jgi:hypothetical protein